MTKLGILIAIFAMLITNLSHAETIQLSPSEKACALALDACDQAIDKADRTIKAKSNVIKLQKEEIDNLVDQVQAAQEERDSIFRNPILWFVAGIALGGFTYGIIKK